MRRALTSPEERDVALNFVPLLPPPAQEQLLDALLPLAAELDVGSCNRAAQILLSLPREWLVKELKQSVSRFLDNEDEITPELLELYFQVDQPATRQLAEKAAAAAEPMLRDLGEHFLRRIEQRVVSSLEEIENDFLHGNFAGMRSNRCPRCGGTLFYSVSRGSFDELAPPGRRRSCGISIYCSGNCNYMLSHLDGFCPAWAEDITDWKSFSAHLYE
jgi:hypothetical protein